MGILLGRFKSSPGHQFIKIKHKGDYMVLYATIKFNRPIDVDNGDYLSFGGYEMTINNKSFQFDFFAYYGRIDKEDSSVIHIEQRELDEELLSQEDIDYLDNTPINITKIGEFCCYTPNDNPLEIAEILEIELANCSGEYSVSKDVIKSADIVYTD